MARRLDAYDQALRLMASGADTRMVLDALGVEFEATRDELVEMMRVMGRVAHHRSNFKSRWYCDRPDCTGEPHAGWHHCEHPLDGPHTWECRHARANQRPPAVFAAGDASVWMMMAGRGFGKTRAGAEWICDQARRTKASVWGVVAPRREDLIHTCIEGESGILRALDMRRSDDAYNKAALFVRLSNGSIIRGFSTEAPVSVRGPNLHGAWLEEVAQWRTRQAWDDILPAIRRGRAQVVVTTTPKPVPIVREFSDREDGSVAITYGSTFDNERNLSPAAVAELRHRWEGTRRERQELYGELFDDVPGALWRPAMIEDTRMVLA